MTDVNNDAPDTTDATENITDEEYARRLQEYELQDYLPPLPSLPIVTSVASTNDEDPDSPIAPPPRRRVRLNLIPLANLRPAQPPARERSIEPRRRRQARPSRRLPRPPTISNILATPAPASIPTPAPAPVTLPNLNMTLLSALTSNNLQHMLTILNAVNSNIVEIDDELDDDEIGDGYEELLALNELVPPVPKSATAEQKASLLSQNFNVNMLNSSCPVCFCDFTDESVVYELPKCKHIFDVECLKPWLDINKTCPVCRQDIFD